MFKRRIVPIALAIVSLVSVNAAARSLPFFRSGNLVVAVEGCGVEGRTCSDIPGGNGMGTDHPAMGRVTNPSTQQQTSQNVQPAEAAPPTVPPPPPSAAVAPGGAPPASAPETLDQRISNYKARQERLLQGSETVVFSGDETVAHAVKPYPFLFLRGALNGRETVRLATSPGNGAGVNILFVYKLGQPVRDNLSVYVDHGTGYTEAFRSTYMDTGIHVSRADGQVELFIERTLTSNHTAGHDEFVLQNNVFLYRPTPHARDCCGPAIRFH